MNVLYMKCLRSLEGVPRINRVRNEEVHSRAGIKRELASRVDQRVLRWIGHMDGRKKVLMVEVSEGHVWGRLRLGWMNATKVFFCSRRIEQVA